MKRASTILKSSSKLRKIFFLRADRRDSWRPVISFGAECGYCGSYNYFPKVMVDGNNQIHCLSCGEPNTMPLLLEIKPRPETVQENLDHWLEVYGVVAFWGLGSMFKALIDPALINRPGIYLLDAGASGFYGSKIVERPEVITKYGIHLIIIMPEFSPAHPLIRREAEEKYGQVDIVTIYDMMTPPFLRTAGSPVGGMRIYGKIGRLTSTFYPSI